MSELNSKIDPSELVPSPEFLARKRRLDDALNLRKPDRVPVAPLVFTLPHPGKGDLQQGGHV